MIDIGKLCYSKTDANDSLAYKSGSGELIYKKAVSAVNASTIYFSWDSYGKDLDICGYWQGAPGMKVGWSYSGSGTFTSGVYKIEYSGDVTSAGGTEWIKPSQVPFSSDNNLVFCVCANFYGYSSDYPTSMCNIFVNQPGNNTFMKNNHQCGTRARQAANPSVDAICTITFDATGKVVEIN